MKPLVRGTQGIGLLEVIVSASLGVLLIYIVGQFFVGSMRLNRDFLEVSGARSDLALLGTLIDRMGQTATSCTHSVGPPVTLLCQVDFNHPPTGSTTSVQLAFTPGTDGTGDFRYQRQVAGTWVTLLDVENVTGFVVCGDADMSTPGACALPVPDGISAVYQVYGARPSSNRYFRYAITALVGSSPAKLASIQSGFYIRNPGPYGMLYEWDY